MTAAPAAKAAAMAFQGSHVVGSNFGMVSAPSGETPVSPGSAIFAARSPPWCSRARRASLPILGDGRPPPRPPRSGRGSSRGQLPKPPVVSGVPPGGRSGGGGGVGGHVFTPWVRVPRNGARRGGGDERERRRTGRRGPKFARELEGDRRRVADGEARPGDRPGDRPGRKFAREL